MTDLAKLHNTQFQLALGDNFYFHGVTDTKDKRFKVIFFTYNVNLYLINKKILGNIRRCF